MTNRLELNWKLDGFVDEQRYYCSETPISTDNLPSAKAVLSGDVRTYVDTAIEVGKSYCVRLGSVKNNVEKISTEKSVDTLFNNVELLIFADSATFPSTAITDSSKTPKTLTKLGNVQIVSPTEYAKNYDDGWLKFDGSGDGLSATLTALGTSDFTFECFASMYADSSKASGRILHIGDTSAGTITFHRYLSTDQLGVTLIDSSGYNTFITTTNTFVSGTKYHLCFMRKSGVFYVFIDGVVWGSSSAFIDFNITKTLLYIGSNNTATEELSAYISSIRLTRYARYNTSGFTTPSFKFPKS